MSQDLKEALGDVIAGIDEAGDAENPDARRYGDLVEVYVPLRFSASGPVLGAFEVYVPYKTFAAAGDRKVRRTVFFLLDGLVLLWAALFRLVAGASRRLRNQAEENRKLAREDALTGLANRTSFLELSTEALARRPAHAAVLLLDLDRFKDLNDSLGHHAGDLLLREIGPRLTSALPPGTVIARLGGDEFVALLAPLDHPDAARAAADAARASLGKPVEIEGIAVASEGSVGIAHYPEDGQDVATLLQRADVAMYEAKERRTGVADYQPDADRSSHERLLILAQLREAIERDELVLHYQPAGDAGARDHRERPDDRAREGAADAVAAALHGSSPRRRRLRHRPLLAGLPAQAAAQHAQDRPLLRDGGGRGGRRDRPFHRRPRALTRARRRRRGHRGPRHRHRPARARLRPRPGPPLRPPRADGRPPRLAGTPDPGWTATVAVSEAVAAPEPAIGAVG